MTLTLLIDGQPVNVSSVTIAVTTQPLNVGPTSPFKTIASAAAVAPSGAVIRVSPGIYKEAVAFDRPVTLQALDWRTGLPTPALGGFKPTVIIDATGLALPEDKSALLFRANGTVRGIEIVGAVSTQGNGAGIRNYPGFDVTIQDCNIHGNEMGIMVSGGSLLVERTDSHHNTGDGNCHPLYYAQADVNGRLVVVDSRFYHCPNGNSFKSRAVDTSVKRCWFGSISISQPNTLPLWGTMNPPPPDSTAAKPRYWLGDHAGCNCGGQSEAGKSLDICEGGRLSVVDSVILKASTASGFTVGYCFETTRNGVFDTTIQNTLISKQCQTYIGNRGPGSVMTLTDCTITGDVLPGGYMWGKKPMIRDLGTASTIVFAGTTPAGG